MQTRYIYETATGRLLSGPGVIDNPVYDVATQSVIELDGVLLDFKTQRIDTNTLQPRDATPEELAADADAVIQAESARDGDQQAIKTTVVWVLYRMLGRAPTSQEIQTARNEWATVYRQLS